MHNIIGKTSQREEETTGNKIGKGNELNTLK